MTLPIISVLDLKIAFKERDKWKEALKGVSFAIYENEIVGIVGESGSGKTLTALSIIQLLPSLNARVSGSVVFNDGELEQEMLSISESEKTKIRGNKISMIFQEPMTSLNPVLRCGKQVQEALDIHSAGNSKEHKKEVLSLFAKVDLPDPERIYRSYPHELSGGQLQRVMIAMALICKPTILIADEPTTALDVTVQKTIVHLLKQLQKEYGFSVIFISHDLNLVGQLADRIIVMKDGAIMEQGLCKELFTNPKNNYTKALLASRPPMNKKLKKLPTVESFLAEDVLDTRLEFYSQIEVNNRIEKLSEQDPILTVTGIEKHFISKKHFFKRKQEVFKAVNDVSFDIYPGETLGLVGESGCGKSTLGKTVLKLITADAGEIIFEGNKITNLNETVFRDKRKDIQIIFQY